MARPGHRYPLLLYTRMIDRWWPATLFLGLSLFLLAWAVWMYFPDDVDMWRWLTLASVGGFVLAVTLILLLLRKAAYVQPFNDHLRLATPFLRMNISYKRVRQATSATMAGLFSGRKLSGWQREILEPLAKKTAIVLELNGYPTSQTVLRFFLSPFFFKDKTPHFVLLVDDWMRFSAELESMRVDGGTPPAKRPVNQSILSKLPHNR